MGKYEKTDEQVLMPVNMMVAHAVADGYHAGMFFQKLQEAVDQLDFVRDIKEYDKLLEVLTESEDDVKHDRVASVNETFDDLHKMFHDD